MTGISTPVGCTEIREFALQQLLVEVHLGGSRFGREMGEPLHEMFSGSISGPLGQPSGFLA